MSSDVDCLREEFSRWSVNEEKNIQLISIERDGTDRVSVTCVIDENQGFVLYCPSGYPNYQEDDNFFVEADSSLQLWCNALNEFLLDSVAPLRLPDILGKGASLYSCKDREGGAGNSRSTEDSEEEDDFDDFSVEDSEEDLDSHDDDELNDMLDKDLSWGLEVSRRRKAWKLKEEELREKEKTSSRSGDGCLAYKDAKLRGKGAEQVFTKEAASGILINDLLAIMKSQDKNAIEADTVEDNIFRWNVKMYNFSNKDLSDDLDKLNDEFGYSYIELQLDFNMDLHPFFPPLVKVVRPRLQECVMSRVSTMELLKLHHWDPARDMQAVLSLVKNYLSEWARVELSSPRNSRERYPEGAYIQIEQHLLRLALVSEVAPRVNNKFTASLPSPPAFSPVFNQPQEFTSVEISSDKDEDEDKHIDDDKDKPTDIYEKNEGEKTEIEDEIDCYLDVDMDNDAFFDTPMEFMDDYDSGTMKLMLSKLKEKHKLMAEKLVEAQGSNSDGNPNLIKVENPTPSGNGLADDGDKSSGKDLFKKVGEFSSKVMKLGEYLANRQKKLGARANKQKSSGVGYSNMYSKQKGWDVEAYKAAQKEKDEQIQMVLEKICHELKDLRSLFCKPTWNLPDLVHGNDAASASSKPSTRSHTSSMPSVEFVSDCERLMINEVRHPTVQGTQHNFGLMESSTSVYSAQCSRKRKHSMENIVDSRADVYTILESSALIPYFQSKLLDNSFIEVCRHAEVYKIILDIIRELANQNHLIPLLGPLPGQDNSIHSLLQSMEPQASIYLDKIGSASTNGSVPKSSKGSMKCGRQPAAGLTQKGNISEDSVVRDFLSVSKEVTNALKSVGLVPDLNSSYVVPCTPNSESDCTSPSPHPSSSPTLPDPSSNYRSSLQPLQFQNTEFDTASGLSVHAFTAEFNKAGPPTSATIFRVAQEISSLAAPNNLPLTPSSSIFVRSDDSKFTLLKVLISGPVDTPYSSGLYEFDIFFPNTYPNLPPRVCFKTTGGGTVRFNPNLYNCGKVCLSLLGTWEGYEGEKWNAETSTVIQVLISIQSLILCAEPYFNEPGFEGSYGTDSGNKRSLGYNRDVFENNLRYAVLQQLTSPPKGFETVVKTHFYLRRHDIIEEYEKLSEKFESESIKSLLETVKSKLLALEKPANLEENL